MRTIISLISFLFLFSCSNSKNEVSEISYTHLKDNFQNPPVESGVNCWWWWLNGNVTKEAITKDLEAMKSKKFQGAMIFDAGGHNQRGNKDIPAGPLYGTDEWNKLFVFALDEAERLGLQMGFNIQSGWNLGGPGVTPQYAAKQLTFSEIKVIGDREINEQIDLPPYRKFYKDVAVLAFPIETENITQEKINYLDYKLGFHELGGSAPDCRFLLFNDVENEKEKKKNTVNYIIKKENIINLSAFMNKEGKLNWKAPGGKWNIMRIGYTCTDAEVSTSSTGWQGLVLDYMSKDAFDFYWNSVVEPILEAAGHHVGTTLKYMETDSWECGGMNWTDNFANEFKNYRGYDLKNYLPVIGGYIIENVDASNAFLADFRKTLADLVANNHYAYFAQHAHKYNMGIQPESAGPHAGPLDGIKNYGFSDIVMSEFWSPSPHRPNPEDRFFLKQASSAAHIYGKKIVGAESFTTIGHHWNDELWHDQKSAFDHEICAGLNRAYFHTFTCSPSEMGMPGQEYFAGTHINPQVTWWNESDAFIDYLRRVQLIVQNGKFVADVLYYYGDHVPNVFPIKHTDPAGAMPGFDYDVTNEGILLQLKVNNGKIVVPSGIEYKVLVLPDHKVLSMDALKKIEHLLSQGAEIIGYKPEHLVSLVGESKTQSEFHKLTEKIWGTSASKKGIKKYKKGVVAWGISARDYLMSKNLLPDFKILNDTVNTDNFDFIHYKFDNKDIYFVSNQTDKAQEIQCQFRISGFQPEIWDALNGEHREATSFYQKDNCTSLPLAFDPYGSIFIVFNKQIDKNRQGKDKSNYPDYETVKIIEGAWNVFFEPKLGGPGKVTFTGLTDWSTSSDNRIKYYSGPAIYYKTFDFSPEQGSNYSLQLEEVKDVGIAVVKINGKDKGITWTKPFRIDISNELINGENTLEIKIINSWYNRVVGDEIHPNENQLTKTNIVLENDFRGRPLEKIPLEPSGLLGPVSIAKRINKME